MSSGFAVAGSIPSAAARAVRTKRAAALELEPATAHPEDIGLTPVSGPLQLERYFAGW